MEEHGEKGKLFYEIHVGNCTKYRSAPCEYCQFFNRSVPKYTRPNPDYSVLPIYKYRSLTNTPLDDRTTDDYVPRARLKEAWKKQEISSNNNDQIQHFAETFIVDKEYVLAYVQHLEMQELQKKKRAEKREAKKAETTTSNEDDDVQITEDDANEGSRSRKINRERNSRK